MSSKTLQNVYADLYDVGVRAGCDHSKETHAYAMGVVRAVQDFYGARAEKLALQAYREGVAFAQEVLFQSLEATLADEPKALPPPAKRKPKSKPKAKPSAVRAPRRKAIKDDEDDEDGDEDDGIEWVESGKTLEVLAPE